MEIPWNETNKTCFWNGWNKHEKNYEKRLKSLGVPLMIRYSEKVIDKLQVKIV